jgi:hypothetical protein
MKSLLIFCSAIALILLTGIARSYSPSELNSKGDANIDRVAQLKIADSTDNKVTEVDGVQLEILMPERELIIPNERHNRRIYTAAKIGIRITNTTALPLRFTLFNTLVVELSGANGYRVHIGVSRDVTIAPQEADYPLVKPGESTTFWRNASVEWTNDGNELTFGFNDGFGGGWSFGNLKPNQYQLKLFYQNNMTTETIYDSQTNQPKLLDNFWVGTMVSPAVEINLIERH